MINNGTNIDKVNQMTIGNGFDFDKRIKNNLDLISDALICLIMDDDSVWKRTLEEAMLSTE